MTQLDKLREVLKESGPVKITLGDTGVFESEEHDVVIIHVLSTDLHNLRRKVENAVENTQTFPDYKPHITIAYVTKGKGKEYAEKLNTLKGKEITLDTLTFSDTDRNHVYFPLNKEAHQFSEVDHDLIHKAKQHFGETKNIREAGYLLHDGKMLDFTGRHQQGSTYKRNEHNENVVSKAGERDYSAGSRAVDHREVHPVVGKGGTEGMHHFMKKTGAIRLYPEQEFGIHVHGPHNKEQLKHIVRHVRGYKHELSVDVDHKHNTHSKVFKSPTVDAVHDWIESVKAGKHQSQHSEEKFSQGHLNQFTKEMHDKHPGLKSLWLNHKPQDNRIHLDDLQVHKEHRKQGIGSSVLKSLTELADKHNHKISLTTATKDDHNGTTSASRLKKFYGRFGFKKNKDLSVTANMMREPNSQHEEEQFAEVEFTGSQWTKKRPIKVLKNPSKDTLAHFAKNREAVRGLHNLSTGDHHYWNADDAVHSEMIQGSLQLEGVQHHRTHFTHHQIDSHLEQLEKKTKHLQNGKKFRDGSEQFAEDDLLANFLSQSLANQIQSTQQEIISLKWKATEMKLPELAQVVQQELRKLDQHLNQGLIHVGYQGAIEGTAEVVEAYENLPTEQKVQKPTSNSVTPTPSIEGDTPTPPKPPKSPLEALGEPIPPEVRLPDLERAIMTLMRPTAMVGTDWKETAELVKAGAFAITSDITQHQSTEVQLALAEAMSEGHSASEFIETVQEKIFEGRGPLSDSHLENIFRTNTLRQKSNAKERTLKTELVADAFPYRAYNATADARTRPHHKALEHLGLDNTNIYNADDPVFLKYRPVWWYSCRCNHYGVTVVQAANKGVKEAVEWVDRAKQTAEIEGGSFYQYLSSTKPLFFQMVPPVPFDDESFNDAAPAVSQHEEEEYQFGEVPKKLYRGIMHSGKGAGTYSLGKGIYSTHNKSYLKNHKFDKVVELDPKEYYPKKPLLLKHPDHFTDWLLQKSGHKNIRDFNKEYSDPGEFVKKHEYDGVHAGNEIVKY